MIRAWLAAALCLAATIGGAQTPTPEVPDPSFGDIAAVFPSNASPTGAIIVYNPNICAQIGPFACEFFRVHEHGHVASGHVFQPGKHPAAREAEADLYAATYANPQAVFAAWQLFMAGGSSSNWHTYGTPYQRANRLCNYAAQAGNWMGKLPCP